MEVAIKRLVCSRSRCWRPRRGDVCETERHEQNQTGLVEGKIRAEPVERQRRDVFSGKRGRVLRPRARSTVGDSCARRASDRYDLASSVPVGLASEAAPPKMRPSGRRHRPVTKPRYSPAISQLSR